MTQSPWTFAGAAQARLLTCVQTTLYQRLLAHDDLIEAACLIGGERLQREPHNRRAGFRSLHERALLTITTTAKKPSFG